MYAYDELDRTIINERVEEFRDQVKRRLSGELTEDEFKMLRLQNGVYLQLHAYMFRVAIPYGTLSSEQLRRLAHVARKYDRGYGHFTTRQNIQFNWIKLAELPDALADLAEVGIHAMQTSGNNTRNVTSDQWAGVAPGEIEDPRIWSELLRQYTTLHPEFSFLPRKFKFAITASDHDRAAIKVHDIGLRLYKNEAGETGFEVLVGGGLGRTPFIGKTIKPFVHGHDLLSYVEAILRVYNQYGRRDNIYKARIKILVTELGAEEFARQVQAEWQEILPLGIDAPLAEIDRIEGYFAPPAYETGLADEIDLSDPDFAVWVKQNVHAHKAPGYAIATISLKPVGGIPGDASSAQIDLIADLAERYSFDELRVTHAQNLVLPHVRKADLYALWQRLRDADLANANLDLASDIIACPGLDDCSLANARSIPVAQALAVRLAPIEQDLGELKIK
ncbi:MAG: nitrite/sulfite reductase, partial [Bradyrhizobium sp.]|nr:nitrite/sulfite reductase [Bradyrhizobium sp.]